MAEQRKKGKSGTHKYGRNKVKCASYRVNRYRTNKLRKLRAHIATHASDGCAINSLERVKRA